MIKCNKAWSQFQHKETCGTLIMQCPYIKPHMPYPHISYSLCHTPYIILPMSYPIYHTPYIIPHMSYHICHTPYIMLHMSYLICHTFYAIPICHTSYDNCNNAWGQFQHKETIGTLLIWYPICHTHMLCPIYHTPMSHPICHTPYVITHLIDNIR